MWDTEVVQDAGDAHEFLGAGLDEVLRVVAVNKFRYTKDRKCVQKCNDSFDGSFPLSGVEHNEARSFLLHDQHVLGVGEGAGTRDGHPVYVPAAKERCVIQDGLVHGVWHALLQAITLTMWAGCDEAGDINKSCGPVMASNLKLADGFISSVVSYRAAMTSPDKVNVFR